MTDDWQYPLSGWRLVVAVLAVSYLAPLVCRVRGHQLLPYSHILAGRICLRCRRPGEGT